MNEATTSAAAPVAKLIDEFHKLPGIGPKSAQRLTYHLLRIPPDDALALAQAIVELKERTVLCSVCQNVTEQDPCVHLPRRRPRPRDDLRRRRTARYSRRSSARAAFTGSTTCFTASSRPWTALGPTI